MANTRQLKTQHGVCRCVTLQQRRPLGRRQKGKLPLIIMVIFMINMPTNMPSERDLAQAMFFPFLMMGIYAIVAFVVMCILLFKEGQIGANKYGEDPKEEERALLQHMREQMAAKKMQEKALTSSNSAENTLEQNSN